MKAFASVAILLAILASGGCGGEESGRDLTTSDFEGRAGGPEPVPPLQQASAPHLILYKSVQDGGPEAFMESLIGGTLDLSGPCVAIRSGDEPHVIVTTEGRILVDEEGSLLRVGPHVFRDGDPIISGGGFMGDTPQNETILREPVPAACADAPKVQLSAIYPMPPEGFGPGGTGEPRINPPPPRTVT